MDILEQFYPVGPDDEDDVTHPRLSLHKQQQQHDYSNSNSNSKQSPSSSSSNAVLSDTLPLQPTTPTHHHHHLQHAKGKPELQLDHHHNKHATTTTTRTPSLLLLRNAGGSPASESSDTELTSDSESSSTSTSSISSKLDWRHTDMNQTKLSNEPNHRMLLPVYERDVVVHPPIITTPTLLPPVVDMDMDMLKNTSNTLFELDSVATTSYLQQHHNHESDNDDDGQSEKTLLAKTLFFDAADVSSSYSSDDDDGEERSQETQTVRSKAEVKKRESVVEEMEMERNNAMVVDKSGPLKRLRFSATDDVLTIDNNDDRIESSKHHDLPATDLIQHIFQDDDEDDLDNNHSHSQEHDYEFDDDDDDDDDVRNDYNHIQEYNDDDDDLNHEREYYDDDDYVPDHEFNDDRHHANQNQARTQYEGEDEINWEEQEQEEQQDDDENLLYDECKHRLLSTDQELRSEVCVTDLSSRMTNIHLSNTDSGRSDGAVTLITTHADSCAIDWRRSCIHFSTVGYVIATAMSDPCTSRRAVRHFADRPVALLASGGDTLVAASDDGYLKLLGEGGGDGKCEWIEAHADTPTHLYVSKNGRRVISVCVNHIRIWNEVLEPVHYNNHWIMARADDEERKTEEEKDKEKDEEEEEGIKINCLSIDNESDIIIAGLQNGSVIIWSASDGQLHKVFKNVHRHPIIRICIIGMTAVSVSSDGCVCVTFIEDDKWTRIENTTSTSSNTPPPSSSGLQFFENFSQHGSIEISNNGAFIAFVDHDSVVSILDIDHASCLASVVLDNVKSIESLADDGQAFVWRDSDNTLYLWRS